MKKMQFFPIRGTTVRMHVCEGTRINGEPCTSKAPFVTRGKWYCQWHTPDPKHRAISRFSPKHPLNDGEHIMVAKRKKVGRSKNKVEWQEMKAVEKPKRKYTMRKKPRTDPAPLEATGMSFASSLNDIVRAMTRQNLIDLLTK